MSAPNLIRIFLPLRLRYNRRDKRPKHNRQRREDEEDIATHLGTQDREKLGDDKSCDPVGGKRPALGSTNSFRADELGGQNEGDRAETEAERGDESNDGNDGQDRDGLDYGDTKEKSGGAHAGNGADDAGLAAEAFNERGAAGGDDDIDGGDEEIKHGAVGGEQSGEKGNSVHNDCVDAGELLCNHDNHD